MRCFFDIEQRNTGVADSSGQTQSAKDCHRQKIEPESDSPRKINTIVILQPSEREELRVLQKEIALLGKISRKTRQVDDPFVHFSFSEVGPNCSDRGQR